MKKKTIKETLRKKSERYILERLNYRTGWGVYPGSSLAPIVKERKIIDKIMLLLDSEIESLIKERKT